MARKLKPFASSPRYVSFIRSRDVALERILTNSHAEVSDILAPALHQAVAVIHYGYASIESGGFSPHFARRTIEQIDQRIDYAFQQAAPKIALVIQSLRKNSYLLSLAGESEAMSRALGKNTKAKVGRLDLNEQIGADSRVLGNLRSRVDLALARIRRDLIDAVELSKTMGDPIADAMKRVKRALPPIRTVKTTPRALTRPKLTEAAKKPEDDEEVLNDFGSEFFIDEGDWADVVDSYKEKYVPEWRSSEKEFDIETAGDEEATSYYAWEIEQEMTHDFVDQVRQGENDAAKENGVTDFSWIAVVDKATDECCLWRDGLTTVEIEAQLQKKGDEDCDDSDDGITPPLHMNCRCRLAPMTDDLPETPPSNQEDFEDWLNDPKQ